MMTHSFLLSQNRISYPVCSMALVDHLFNDLCNFSPSDADIHSACDFAILVTEPTPSGFADLERILDVVNHLQIPFGIMINKWDINPSLTKKIEEWSGDRLREEYPTTEKS